MKPRAAAPRTATRLFAVYAIASLVPVLALGFVLAVSYRHDANERGLSEGRSEAGLLARTSIAPLLDGKNLRHQLSPQESAALSQMSSSAIASGQILRLRVRDLNGTVVFASDKGGLNDPPDPEALEAADGETSAELTHLDADDNPNGPQGPRTAEVYRPLVAGSPAHQVGILEVYLPYAPIAHDVDSGLGMLYRDLAIGLAALYLFLALISASATRRLRGQVTRNAYLAEHDPLTGLPNRAHFHELVAEAIAAGERAGTAVAVAVVDLDRFKEVNDTLGHANGDRLLTAISHRLRDAIPECDTVSRLGGDEFGLVLTQACDTADVCARLDDLRRLIEAEVEVSGLPLTVEASIGYAVAPMDGSDGDRLLQHADVAMYVAKGASAGVVRYDPQLDHYDATKLGLIAELRRAISGNELVLHYQPKASLSNHDVVALEALVRWNHPERGMVYPDEFIPVAEQTGIIDSLTRWVIEDALAQVERWGEAAAGLSVAVNISARSISRPDFADAVFGMLAASRVPNERLILEITETALVADPERAGVNLRRLSAAGIRISLDDFGCGQTSLGLLSTLPLHEVKIDKSFVMDMLADRSHLAIVRSVIDLAHNLGFEVVAEGVETEAVLDELSRHGCDIAQGYLLARPMPAAALPGWLLARRPAVVAGSYT